MAGSSSPDITPKEEPVTLDRPESPNPFLPVTQVEFTFDEITFTTNNEVALIYPSHSNQEYFMAVSDFISKYCIKEAFIRAPNQYKEYLRSNPSVLVDKTKSAGDGLKTAHTTSSVNEESGANDISQKVKLKDLSDILKETRSAFFTPDSPTDEPIIISEESEEEENAKNDKDTKDTSVPPL
ncbi:hypothetical protein Tco_0246422 [Tanacetum coccineum]